MNVQFRENFVCMWSFIPSVIWTMSLSLSYSYTPLTR